MNTKHTPGPWKFEKRGGSGRAAIEHNIPETDYPFAVWIPSPPFVMGALGCLVCKTNGICPDESEANARLIAAAPELLAIVKELDDWYNQGTSSGPSKNALLFDDCKNLGEHIRETIKKVRGV